jgi:ABC-2 type transport system ATP-binding protein
MSLLSARSLTKHYAGGVTALDTLTLDVDEGIVGLVGSNGAGKSTLMKILLGLITPTSGTAFVLARDVATEIDEIRHLVGYMPEHDCLPPDVSAAEFVTHMGRMSGLPASAARERAADMLRHVGLFEERYRPIGGYSTGMKQRVKLAQALVHDPRVLFLDEPTNGLDPAGRDEMLELVRRTGREFGISVVVSSHLLGEIERVCDSLVAIENGRLLRSGSLRSVTGETDILVVEVEDGLEELVALLASRGYRVRTDGAVALIDSATAQSHSFGKGADGDGNGESGADEVPDAVRDALVELDLSLLRLERRRSRLEDLFHVPMDELVLVESAS